jgi:hypothetical protein
MTTMHRMTVGRATMLAFSMCLVGCGGSGGPKLTPEQDAGSSDSGGAKLTPEQDAGSTALCDKAAQCAGVSSPSSSEMQQCREQIAGALQIIPDPDAFTACVNSLSCTELQSSDSSKVRACADLARDTFVCSDSATLRGCSNSGKCTSISCPDVCALLEYSFDHCGASNDPAKAASICWCR